MEISLQNSFIEELLQLIAEDDVRVREFASKCLCRFILQNAKSFNSHRQHQQQQQQQQSFAIRDDEHVLHRTYCDNMRMLQDFLEYSIFKDMSPAVSYLLNPEYQQRQQTASADQDILTSLESVMTSPTCDGIAQPRDAIQTVLSKVLYRLTNKVMSFKDKNVQVSNRTVHFITMYLHNT